MVEPTELHTFDAVYRVINFRLEMARTATIVGIATLALCCAGGYAYLAIEVASLREELAGLQTQLGGGEKKIAAK